VANEGAIMRENLPCVVPLIKAGESAVENEVSIIDVLNVFEVVLYVFAMIA
jgi:hypothetical protein